MGDAGMILFGPIGREILGGGTIIFAVFATGSQILAGQLALSVLSNERLCTVAFAGIFTVAVTLASFPRTLDSLGFLSIAGGISIVVAGIVALAGAGAVPIQPGGIQIAVASNFTSAFSESIPRVILFLFLPIPGENSPAKVESHYRELCNICLGRKLLTLNVKSVSQIPCSHMLVILCSLS
jgi:hypothetical protein